MEPSVDSDDSPADDARQPQLRWLPMATRMAVRVPAAIGLVALVVLGVLRLPGDDSGATAWVDSLRRQTFSSDVVEVWRCSVPDDSTADLYGGLPMRVDIDTDAVAEILDDDVRSYFVDISHGRYTPSFTSGGEVRLAPSEGYEACVDKALAASGDSATVVLAIADAEHAPDRPGGYGSAGSGCVGTPPCPARVSRRYAYVGAADFAPRWGPRPPLDLVEHELGHTLGWTHSGLDVHGTYLSALDVMSNSAWPRAVDPERRDAPDTIAIHRVVAGWIEATEVRVVDDAHTVTLVPSNRPPVDLADDLLGTRLMVLRVDATTFLTIEVLTATGFDSHLPADGVAVHRVRVAPEDTSRIESIEPLTPSSAPPYVDLLRSTASLVADGWTITVVDWDSRGWVVSVEPTVR